jgi:hypothetical protein
MLVRVVDSCKGAIPNFDFCLRSKRNSKKTHAARGLEEHLQLQITLIFARINV